MYPSVFITVIYRLNRYRPNPPSPSALVFLSSLGIVLSVVSLSINQVFLGF